jgi:hypothetical protein
MAAASKPSPPNGDHTTTEADVGRRAHKPDPAQRRQVEALAAYGIPETDISRVVGIDAKTLRKYYRDELDLGETKANAQVAGFLFNAAKSGNVTAQIFWLKTRAGWREVPLELKHSVRTEDLTQLSDQELMDLIVEMSPSVGLEPIRTIEAAPAPRSTKSDAIAIDALTS